MEPPETADRPQEVPSEPTAETRSRQDLLLAEVMHDDARSSSLSDIDDRLDSDNIDFSPRKPASEVDSEAETERIEDSPKTRDKSSIVLTSATYGTSPSKLAQSTTYDDLEDQGNESELSPSKPPKSAKSNGVVDHNDKLSLPQEALRNKRKRLASVGDIAESPTDDGPLRKRRGSLSVGRATQETPDEPRSVAAGEPTSKTSEASNDETPVAEDEHATETRSSSLLRGKKADKEAGSKNGKTIRDKNDADDAERENNTVENQNNDIEEEPQVEDEENAEPADDADETEATSKQEESMKKTSAMDTLTSLEHQFASLRDRIYDERIANLNKELAQLEQSNPTHPEFLRQLRVVSQYRDNKVKHENKLFSYKFAALRTKCKAERSQINSSYRQKVREIRESHLEKVSQQHCQIQQDRFQTPDASPEFSISFPMRRSKQVTQQTAHNNEVSVLAGFAKYVGFPASPAIQSARRQEVDEDFERMGIRPTPQHAAGPSENPHG